MDLRVREKADLLVVSDQQVGHLPSGPPRRSHPRWHAYGLWSRLPSAMRFDSAQRVLVAGGRGVRPQRRFGGLSRSNSHLLRAGLRAGQGRDGLGVAGGDESRVVQHSDVVGDGGWGDASALGKVGDG
ncbi:hypothetical protein OG931_00190 [Streptomyces phaeochromogenes]|nr:hypothetical protein [Streptomyces phaeochromogenes]WRZ26278.1 hypothetical protein OG931_00190 [Streptomyces phaeochromogenes]